MNSPGPSDTRTATIAKTAQQKMRSRHKSIPDHESKQNYQADEEIDERNNDGRHGNDHPRKVDLADQVRIRDDAIGSIARMPSRKKSTATSRHKPSADRARPFAGQFRNTAKHDCENDHRENWAENRPDDADNCLLVTDGEVAPREAPKTARDNAHRSRQ